MEIGIGKVKEICRVVRKNFPYESPWMQRNIEYREIISQYKKASKYRELLEVQKKLIAQEEDLHLVRELYNRFRSESSFNYFRELIDAVRKYKVLNCGELARISYAVARMNGVKHSNLDMAILTTKENKDYSKSLFPDIDRYLDMMREMEYGGGYKIIDHVALQIHGKKGKEFILDSLLNECHNKNEAEKVYKTKYGDVLKINSDENLQILNGYADGSDLPKLKNDEAKELLEVYPELKIGGNSAQVKKKKSFLFDLFKR